MKKLVSCIFCVMFIINCSNKQAAVVNGVIIYENEVLEGIKEVDANTVERLGKENLKQNILKGLVERQLLLCKINEENYGKEEEIQKLWLPFKKEAAIKYFINTYLPEKQPVPDNILQDEYNRKKESFKTEGQVHTRHILIRTGKGQHTDEEAQLKITSIAKELKKDGSNFADLAKKYSECPSSTLGGDLSYISRGQMVKPFEDAAFSLKKGEFTANAVRTTYGYHLIYAEDVKEATYPSLDDLKNQLLPGIYIAEIENEYGLTVYSNKDKTNDNLGEIKKLNLKYNRKTFKDEIESIIGKEGALKYSQSGSANLDLVREFLYIKIFEDKMKSFAMEKDKKYLKYINKLYDEYLSSSYLQNIVFKDVSVSEAEVRLVYRSNMPVEMLVQQFGEQFSSNASYRSKIEREQILPYIREQLMDQKKSEIYIKTVDELKKKYPVDVKIEYKTT
ncbi:MAG: peptidylprolyl isomerase [Spirochaetes bacterium]|nr:peptidylprolyl isomerase [Spirochaetota bacterium]